MSASEGLGAGTSGHLSVRLMSYHVLTRGQVFFLKNSARKIERMALCYNKVLSESVSSNLSIIKLQYSAVHSITNLCLKSP